MGAPQQALLGKSASGPASPVPDILWWKMSDGSGTTVTASVGPNGVTTAAWVTGSSGSGFALDFNGSSQDASTVATVTYGVNVITITAWLFLDATSGVVFDSSVGALDNGFDTYINGAQFHSLMYDNVSALYRDEYFTTPSTGSWFNIAIVFDSAANANSGRVRVYINGVSQTMTVAANNKTTANNFPVKTFYAGSFGGSFFYDGRIDDLRIYGRELTGAEILQVVADPQ